MKSTRARPASRKAASEPPALFVSIRNSPDRKGETMTTKQEIEEFRKAVVLYSVASEKPLLSMLKTTSRSEASEVEYLRRQSEAVTAARVAGQIDVIPALLAVHEPIKAAWAAHDAMWSGCKKNEAKISGARELAFLEALAECIHNHHAACETLDMLAGLWCPIETREFSGYYNTADILRTLGSPGEPMSASTWQNRRRSLGNQIDNHPQSGAQRVRFTKYAAEFLGLDLDDFTVK